MKKVLLTCVLSIMATTLQATPTFKPLKIPSPLTPNNEAKLMLKQASNEADHMTPLALYRLLDAGEELILLDIRLPDEINKLGRIAPAGSQLEIARGYLELLGFSALPDKTTKIVVYCGQGMRSIYAANTLKEMGYFNVYNLRGGVKAWLQAGYGTYK